MSLQLANNLPINLMLEATGFYQSPETIDQISQYSQVINYNFIDEYMPESNEIDVETLKTSPIFRKKRYVDAVFFGELANGKRNGKGIMKYKSGRVFEGEWQNDLRHGRGYERYENGNIYLGEFDTGKAHGHGNYSWNKSGEIYDGEWTRGVRHGYGIWRNSRGDSYIGEWKNGKAIGYGVFTWSNGDKYEGEWHANLKHGKGADYFINGDQYRGEYKTGKPDGYGVYTWANGCVYEGHFKCGLKYGKGKWRKVPDLPGAPSNEYSGEYVQDKKCGQGEFKWASGNIYKGQYQDDEREGYGEMIWTDGSRYIGQWIKGIQHGYGKMIFPDGTMKEGYFENNVYVGPIPSKQLQMMNKQQQQQLEQSKYKTPSKNSNNFLQKTEKMVSDMKFYTNIHSGKNSASNLIFQPSQNQQDLSSKNRQKQISINSNVLHEFSQKSDRLLLNRNPSGNQTKSILNRDQQEQNGDDYSKSYNIYNKLGPNSHHQYNESQNKKQNQYSAALIQNKNKSHNSKSQNLQYQQQQQNGVFLSGQKLKNRLNSPFPNGNSQHQISPINDISDEQYSLLARRLSKQQSEQSIKSIKKPQIDKNDNKLEQKTELIELSQSIDYNEESMNGAKDSHRQGRQASFEDLNRNKKGNKTLAKSTRAINVNSQKQQNAHSKKPQIRFYDPDYYHQTQAYNTGLS